MNSRPRRRLRKQQANQTEMLRVAKYPLLRQGLLPMREPFRLLVAANLPRLPVLPEVQVVLVKIPNPLAARAVQIEAGAQLQRGLIARI